MLYTRDHTSLFNYAALSHCSRRQSLRARPAEDCQVPMAVAAPAPAAPCTLSQQPLHTRAQPPTTTPLLTLLCHSAHSPTPDHLTRLSSLAPLATRSPVFLSRPSPSPSSLSPPRPATSPSKAFPESLPHPPRPPQPSQRTRRISLELPRPLTATCLPPAMAPQRLALLARSSPSLAVSAASS